MGCIQPKSPKSPSSPKSPKSMAIKRHRRANTHDGIGVHIVVKDAIFILPDGTKCTLQITDDDRFPSRQLLVPDWHSRRAGTDERVRTTREMDPQKPAAHYHKLARQKSSEWRNRSFDPKSTNDVKSADPANDMKSAVQVHKLTRQRREYRRPPETIRVNSSIN